MKKKATPKDTKKLILKLVILCTILFIIGFVVFQFIYTIYTILNPNMPCKILGFSIYTVEYDTMEPVLKKGDWIVTLKPKEKKLQEGNIIVFKKGDSFIAHRIENIKQKKTGKVYETKGDANTYVDNETLEISNIQGKYVFKITSIWQIIIYSLLIVLVYRMIKILTKNKKNNKRRKTKRHISTN